MKEYKRDKNTVMTMEEKCSKYFSYFSYRNTPIFKCLKIIRTDTDEGMICRLNNRSKYIFYSDYEYERLCDIAINASYRCKSLSSNSKRNKIKALYEKISRSKRGR